MPGPARGAAGGLDSTLFGVEDRRRNSLGGFVVAADAADTPLFRPVVVGKEGFQLGSVELFPGRKQSHEALAPLPIGLVDGQASKIGGVGSGIEQGVFWDFD